MRILVLIAALAATAISAKADNLQPDGTLNGGTNYCAAATTNTYRGTGTIFDASKAGSVIVEFQFSCTNANAMKAGDGPTVTFDGGMNGTQSDRWVTNAIKVVPTAVGPSGTSVLVSNLTAAQIFPFYRVGEVWNTNVSGTNFNALKARVFTVNRF